MLYAIPGILNQFYYAHENAGFILSKNIQLVLHFVYVSSQTLLWLYNLMWCPCMKTSAAVAPTPVFIPNIRTIRVSPSRRISIEPEILRNHSDPEQTGCTIIISSDVADHNLYCRNIQQHNEREYLRIKNIIDNM